MLPLLSMACGPAPQAEPRPPPADDSAVELPASQWTAPDWMAEAPRFTVPEDRGWTWEHDASFTVPDMSVPHLFVAPDGRFGMMATANYSGDFRARSVLWSDDGLEWEAGGALLEPSDFPESCGDRLQDATVLRPDAGTWVFIVEATLDDDDARAFCATSTADLQSWTTEDSPIFAGSGPKDRVSVPSAMAFPERNLLWYNNMSPQAEGGDGIRVVELGEDLEVAAFHPTPYWGGEHVDPMPVYREGGGVRLYFTRLANPAPGLYAVDLDEELLPPAEDAVQVVPSPGEADPEAPAWYMDPAFLALPDGRLLLYTTFGVFTDGGFEVQIHRYVATD